MWRAAPGCVLLRRVTGDDGARLVGLAALVWVAADVPSTVGELAAELGVADAAVDEAVSMLQTAGWLSEGGAR